MQSRIRDAAVLRMKVSTEFPPNYREIVTALGDVSKHGPIFCYGDTIHNPFGREVTEDLVAHEQRHSEQQGNDPEGWWMRYLYDTDFRLSQEIEGYGAQYAFAKSHGVRGKLLDWALDGMAKSLSGELYGNLLSHNEARSKIRNYAR